MINQKKISFRLIFFRIIEDRSGKMGELAEMIKDNKILLGKAGDKDIYMYPSQMNRHGLIAGASGTGKTVTLKVIAESLSEIGVPSVIADVKGDLTGMIVSGDQQAIQGRLDSLSITDFKVQNYPVHFLDVYQESGHPVRASMQEMGPLMLSRIMDLTDAQEGVLNIVFKVAEDMKLDIIDLKDLQAMTNYVSEHAKDLSSKYGNVSKQSVGVLQRKLLELENEGGDLFFGMPAFNIEDCLTTEGGQGVMSIIECQKLFQHPALYSMFLFWMLTELYNTLPEAGDLEKPKVVFFFDEAHLLFDEAPKALLEKIEQTVKLIRSKGVGVFFITQSPDDIPGAVLGQLSNRVQHSLRAYTPAEIKAAKSAAASFRENPGLNTADLIANMKTGEALVSVLNEEGEPTIVEKTTILPPKSSMKAADQETIKACIKKDSLYGKYEKAFDPVSAYESMEDIQAQEEAQKQKETDAKEQAKQEEKKAKEEEKARKNQKSWSDKMARKAQNRIENEVINFGVRQAKKFLKDFLK